MQNSHVAVPWWLIIVAVVGGYLYFGHHAAEPVPVPFLPDVAVENEQAARKLFPALAANCYRVADRIDAGAIKSAQDAIREVTEGNKAAKLAALSFPEDALSQADGELNIISRTLRKLGDGYTRASKSR